MKEKMTELIMRDHTLEHATMVDKMLNDFTDNLESELAAYSVNYCSLVHESWSWSWSDHGRFLYPGVHI